MKKKRKRQRQSERDKSIVQHTARYRLTTNRLLHEHFFCNKSLNATAKVTSRLCHEGWLASFTLIYPERYFVPGPRAIQHLGLPEKWQEPLGPQSLPTEYAVVIYVTRWMTPQRMTPEELMEYFPWYPRQLARAPHCHWPTPDSAGVDLIRVDLGGTADHVARKCFLDIEKRAAAREFADCVRHHKFRLLVLTTSSDKGTAIKRAMQNHIWPDKLAIHISIVTEILPLLSR